MMRLANRLSQSKRRIIRLPIKAASRLTPSRYRAPVYLQGLRQARRRRAAGFQLGQEAGRHDGLPAAARMCGRRVRNDIPDFRRTKFRADGLHHARGRSAARRILRPVKRALLASQRHRRKNASTASARAPGACYDPPMREAFRCVQTAVQNIRSSASRRHRRTGGKRK